MVVIPPFEQRKRKIYCKFHNVYGHFTSNCLCFKDMIQKAIDEGRLKFEQKPIQVNTDPFQVQTNYAEPVQILMVGASIGMSKVKIALFEYEDNQALVEIKKEEEYVSPLVGETLIEFLTKKQKAGKKGDALALMQCCI